MTDNSLRYTDNEFISLILILLSSLIFRIYKIWDKNIWLDEGHSIRIAESPNLYNSLTQAAHPPLHYVLLKLQLGIFGYNEILLRFFSVVLGLGSVIVIYKIGSVFFNYRAGMYSAVLLTLSINHIEFSQEIRMYSILTFLTSISYYFFLKLLYDKESKNLELIYILSTLGVAYTHYYGLFVVLTQIISVLIMKPKLLVRKFYIIISFGIGYIPALILLYTQIWGVQSGFVSTGSTGFRGIIGAIYWVAGSNYYVSSFVLVGMIITSSSLLHYFLKTETSDKKTLFNNSNHGVLIHLALWNSIIFIGPFVIQQLIRLPTKGHYFQSGFIPLFLFAGIGFAKIDRRISRDYPTDNSTLYLLMIMFILFISISFPAYYSSLPTENNEIVSDKIEQNYNDGDVILFNADSIRPPICFYANCSNFDMAYGGAAWQEPYYDKNNYISGTSLDKPPSPRDIDGYDRVWFVDTHSTERDSHIINNFNKSSCWEKSNTNLEDEGLYLFEKHLTNNTCL
jgi:4-amino-4-deoxy-L-arabinose transferase-like glycosyltransferase